MKRGQKKETDPILEALRAATHDEKLAVEFIEAHRWGDTPACPLCGDLDVYKMLAANGVDRNADFRWRCRGCKKMFTVRTRTVLAETRLELKVWCYVLWSAASNKKGVSALQIKRECEISYKSALYLLHRVRKGMSTSNEPHPKLSGTCEADEAYFGGVPRNKGLKSKCGLGTDKTPVVAVVERGGDVRARVILGRVTANDLNSALLDNVDASSRLITDESQFYRKIGKAFRGGHATVCHKKREYVRGDVHSNTIEGVFANMKRGFHGIYHSTSKKHLHRYVDQFVFLYNNRHVDDGARVSNLVKSLDGKRLTYAQQIAG